MPSLPSNIERDDLTLGVATMAVIVVVFVFIFGLFIGWWFALAVVVSVVVLALLIITIFTKQGTHRTHEQSNNKPKGE